jgi:hypothetical protein
MKRNFALSAVLALAASAGLAHAQLGTGGGTQVGSALTLTTNNAQQQIEVVIGPLPGDVQVTGVDNAGSYTGVGSISLTTGSGLDVIVFRILTNQVPDITVATGGNDSDVSFLYEIDFTAEIAGSNVTVTGGSGNDKVSFQASSLAAGVAARWNVNHFGGNNETKVEFNATGASEFLDLNLNTINGGGQDLLSVAVVSAALDNRFRLTGTMGGNNDTAFFNFDGISPSALSLNYLFDMGAGNDVAEVTNVTRGGIANVTGAVAGGNGLDSIKFLLEGSGTSNLSLQGGAGADTVEVDYKGTIDGSPFLIGNGGNDVLKLVVTDGPQISTPTLDGGPGIDTGIGFGTFISIEQF